MALARWLLVEPSGVTTLLAPDDVACLAEAALGENRGTFRRRPPPARSGLESAWLPRPLVLALADPPAAGPALSAPLTLRAALASVVGAPGPTLLEADASDRQRSLALDELLGCWADLAAAIELAPFAVGVEGGEVWARIDPGGITTDAAADRLLLLRAAWEITADARGLAVARMIVDLAGAAGGAALDVGSSLYGDLAAAVARED